MAQHTTPADTVPGSQYTRSRRSRPAKLPESALMFLATLDGLSRDEALANVGLEARISRWTVAVAREVRVQVMQRYAAVGR